MFGRVSQNRLDFFCEVGEEVVAQNNRKACEGEAVDRLALENMVDVCTVAVELACKPSHGEGAWEGVEMFLYDFACVVSHILDGGWPSVPAAGVEGL